MLKRNLIANYLGQGWVFLMGVAFVPLYIKFLGVESYGLIGMFAVLTAWLSLLDMGMTPTLSREMARFTSGRHTAETIRDLLRSVEIIVFGIACLVAIGVAMSSGWIASSWLKVDKLPVEDVAQAFAVMGLVVALRFVEGIYRSCMIGLQRQVLFNVVNSSMATLRGLGVIAILVWVSPTIQAFFMWHGVVSVATLIILAGTTYAGLPQVDRTGRFSLCALRKIWKFAGGIMGITFLSILLMQVDKVFLSKILHLTDYGYYMLACTVAGAIYVVLSPIGQAWFPRLTELVAKNDERRLITTYHEGAQLVSVIAGSAAIVMMVFAEQIIYLWTQDKDMVSHVAPLVRILVMGNLLNGLMWIPYQAQLAYGWTMFSIWVNIISVIIIIPAILFIAPLYGAKGAALVWGCLNAGYVLIAIHFMYRRILTTEKWRWYMQDLLMPLLVGVTASLGVRWLMPVSTSVICQSATLAFVSCLTLIASGLAASLVRRQIYDVILSFVNPLFSKNILRRL